jgi:hypothetical protein
VQPLSYVASPPPQPEPGNGSGRRWSDYGSDEDLPALPWRVATAGATLTNHHRRGQGSRRRASQRSSD